MLLGESAAHAPDAPSPDPLAVVYLHEPGSFRPLAQLRRNGGADQRSQVYHYHLDHLGTPQELTNDNGELVWQAEYRAWGALAKLHVAAVDNPLRFQGQYHDPETGLHYNRHRYYAPNEGCFTSQDPIRLAGGSNLAAYAPNPVEWVDPLGLSCEFDTNVQRWRDRRTGRFTPAPSVETPYGPAIQSSHPDALAARAQVQNGATLYRTGTMGKSQAAEAQFWALESPSAPGYAARYGIPPENVTNANFIEMGKIKPGTEFITRTAPPVGTNPGGGVEVVTPENGVSLFYFGTK